MGTSNIFSVLTDSDTFPPDLRHRKKSKSLGEQRSGNKSPPKNSKSPPKKNLSPPTINTSPINDIGLRRKKKRSQEENIYEAKRTSQSPLSNNQSSTPLNNILTESSSDLDLKIINGYPRPVSVSLDDSSSSSSGRNSKDELFSHNIRQPIPINVKKITLSNSDIIDNIETDEQKKVGGVRRVALSNSDTIEKDEQKRVGGVRRVALSNPDIIDTIEKDEQKRVKNVEKSIDNKKERIYTELLPPQYYFSEEDKLSSKTPLYFSEKDNSESTNNTKQNNQNSINNSSNFINNSSNPNLNYYSQQNMTNYPPSYPHWNYSNQLVMDSNYQRYLQQLHPNYQQMYHYYYTLASQQQFHHLNNINTTSQPDSPPGLNYSHIPYFPQELTGAPPALDEDLIPKRDIDNTECDSSATEIEYFVQNPSIVNSQSSPKYVSDEDNKQSRINTNNLGTISIGYDNQQSSPKYVSDEDNKQLFEYPVQRPPILNSQLRINTNNSQNSKLEQRIDNFNVIEELEDNTVKFVKYNDYKKPIIQSRGGIIPFTIVNGKIVICTGKDRKFGEITDFGGKAKYNENAIQAAFREFHEETCNVFQELNMSEEEMIKKIGNSFILLSMKTLIIFVRLDCDYEKKRQEFLEVQSTLWYTENSDFYIDTLDNIRSEIIKGEKSKIKVYKVVNDLLRSAFREYGDLSFFLSTSN